MQTENAEMYLVTMALLEEQGTPPPIPLPQLAEALDIQVVSVNQMIKKLEEAGLVSYQPYKGVSFSEVGAEQAKNFLRHRRLWETFFVEYLGYSPAEADTLACRMEHVTEPEISKRLAQFLNNPANSPTGKPIPRESSAAPAAEGTALSRLRVGQQAEVEKLTASPAISSYLEAQGIVPGSRIRVQAISSEQVWLVAAGENSLSLENELANQILVSIIKGAPNER